MTLKNIYASMLVFWYIEIKLLYFTRLFKGINPGTNKFAIGTLDPSSNGMKSLPLLGLILAAIAVRKYTMYLISKTMILSLLVYFFQFFLINVKQDLVDIEIYDLREALLGMNFFPKKSSILMFTINTSVIPLTLLWEIKDITRFSICSFQVVTSYMKMISDNMMTRWMMCMTSWMENSTRGSMFQTR